MLKKLVLGTTAACLLLAGLAPSSQAQQRRQMQRYSTPQHKLELTPFGGYVWTVSRRVQFVDGTGGDIDLVSSGFYGIQIDINVAAPGTQIALLFQRQDTDIEYKRFNGLKQDLGKVGVEYWHIGVVKGFQQGDTLPFTYFSLGGTRYDFDGFGDAWKFSIMMGLGAKVYISDRIGLKFQGRMPFTFFSSGFGLGYGSGGVYTTVGGTGLAQFDLSAGLMILI